MNRLISRLLAAYHRARLVMAQSDLDWVEATHPARLAAQREQVARIARRLDRLEGGMCNTGAAISAESVRYAMERRAKGGLL